MQRRSRAWHYRKARAAFAPSSPAGGARNQTCRRVWPRSAATTALSPGRRSRSCAVSRTSRTQARSSPRRPRRGASRTTTATTSTTRSGLATCAASRPRFWMPAIRTPHCGHSGICSRISVPMALGRRTGRCTARRTGPRPSSTRWRWRSSSHGASGWQDASTTTPIP